MKTKLLVTPSALWIGFLIMAVLNIFMLIGLLVAYGELLSLRRQAADTISSMSTALEEVRSGTFEYAVQIDQEIPINDEIPIEFVVQVPIHATIPVNTTVSVPVEIPLVGTTYISIPIIADIPINLTVDVPVRQTIPIALRVPIQMDVPISIQIADTPLAQSLAHLQAVLDELAAGLHGSAARDQTTP
ncbi:MAG: hypothetical protein JXB85_04305 [Anaerolineales bacterium]|nr:hypothetical protein [Anaerolineales bacterium]